MGIRADTLPGAAVCALTHMCLALSGCRGRARSRFAARRRSAALAAARGTRVLSVGAARRS